MSRRTARTPLEGALHELAQRVRMEIRDAIALAGDDLRDARQTADTLADQIDAAAERAGATGAPEMERCGYAVEATDYERTALWSMFHERVRWECDSRGRLVTIGELAGRPVAVCLTWATIEGRRVVFYETTSRVVDHDLVERWVREHALTARAERTDASNFHNIVHAIRDANERAAAHVNNGGVR